MPPKREFTETKAKVEANEAKTTTGPNQIPGLTAIESIFFDRLPQGRALNRWDAEAERDLIMACLTSENNNYPTINWPRVKLIMDDRGYKFSRSALDQRWSKTIMKEWRERKGPGTLTDFVDPDTANNTPARKRGRIQAVARAKQNQRIAEALAARNLANSTGSNSPAGDNSAQGTAAQGDPGHATRNLEHRLFGTAAADTDDAEDLGEDTKKFLMQPRPSTGASEKSGSSQPSPGDIEFLRQCDRFRLEEGNKVSEDPPKKRRAPRRSKEEMEKVRAEKEAARLKREAARAAKLAALGAKQQPKKDPKVVVKKEEAGTPRQPPPLFQPAAPSTGHQMTIDFNDIPLFPGAVMPNTQVNSAQATNTPTYNRPGSMTAVPSTRATPVPDAFGRTQGFDTTMNYQAPANQISLPPFQTLLREPPLQLPQPSNFHYQMPPPSYGFGHGFDMLGHYAQPMGGNDFNFGMQQHGYMQPNMNSMPQPSHYPLGMDSMFDMGPIYGSSQEIDDQQLASDATVVCDGAIKTEPGTEQQTATDSQSYMQLLAPTGTQPAPMVPMDVQPATAASMATQVAPLAPMDTQPVIQTQAFMAIQSDIQPQSDIQLQSDTQLQSDIQPQSSIETSNSAQPDNGGARPDAPVADLVPGSSAGSPFVIL